MKLKHILLTLVLALTTVAASAQALKPATAAQQRDMTARINKVASTTQSITCNFTQVKTMSFLNEKLTSTGRMFYDNKGRLRWEYTKPYSLHLCHRRWQRCSRVAARPHKASTCVAAACSKTSPK